ncbi:DEAD/DEAH box helicase [Flavisolibacter tropicus]|uniref:Helicase SNF2 n=1 Tax=Flavisolibacter tropicus TaxID=1492898 RepID=A0A172TXA2_9BACT|nr:DEAD/DEAH box helicase [Flavisolibacter tropicus]ANE51719.1 helicase SNF2 [Flavisolibacter tropicus]
MALPHLLKYIYTHGNDEVIRRGKKIHAIGFVELVEHDDLFGSAVFRVKDDNYATFYKVFIQQYKDPKALSLRCACPYNLGDICRHEAAALFRLQELMDKGLLKAGDVSYNQQHTVAKMKAIEIKTLRLLCSQETFEEAESYLRKQKPLIESAKDEMVKATVKLNGEEYYVIIRRNEERTFDTSSNYVDTEHPLCLPKIIVFLHLFNLGGTNYFDSIRNWDKEKNKLLEAYGYSLSDNLKGKFEFNYKDGKPYLRVLDPSIKRVAVLASAPTRPVERVVVQTAEPEEVEKVVQEGRQLGLVFNLSKPAYPFFTLDLVEGEKTEDGAFVGTVQKLELSKYINLDIYKEADRNLILQVRKLQDTEVNKYINRNSPFSGFWENIVHHEGEDLPEETKALIAEYLLPKLKKLGTDYAELPVFVLAKGKTFKTANLIKVEFNTAPLVPQFSVAQNNAHFEIECFVMPESVAFGLEDNEAASPLFFLYNHELFFWNSVEAASVAAQFLPGGNMKVEEEAWPVTLNQIVLPLAKEYKVDFDKSLIEEIKDGEPDVKLYLQEKGDYLVFQPIFNYKGFDTKAKDRDEMIIPLGNRLIVVHRNKVAEQAFIHRLQTLHSNFVPFEEGAALALKGADVLKNNWFFLFVDAMKDQKVPVYGFESLKNFRFNTAKPQTHIYISSNTDWFDAKVDILFGDQKVSVAEVKKALANKQQFVQLNDGTLGILPDEWLKKYALLFRVGEGKSDKLKLSRYHLSVIDELYDNRNEEELTIELEEKYERIREFDKIKEIPPPEHLEPILRPYQKAGFQWINYLHEVSWGGILADDMGLGKTIQALSYLYHYHDTYGQLKALVVCPTTLIYNWENEINKFAPGLSYHIHHGPQRIRDHATLNKFDIIITTYGTLRSDIKTFVEMPLDYVVLDESQAIKNPASKVTKAAALLKAKHRLCLSGTPLQNNTFDIFAQMNFLNPGMLGTMEFFRQEFAIPIDKFGEKEQKEHLKKILYPFILRRTKEQVAKDLPEKTEMVLFCEMETEQRRIYDAYRNDFRARILGTIDEQGIQKSQLTILQGLMKLRQICDSPAILNETEKYENHSIKLEELAREINENIGDHKALIFSQFLGMLALIREKLESSGVKYEYFDGSTSAPDREKAIQNFQNDDETRVFLISLKAGGVGLNLTAADYVYIVDPWWNPAVEQQAIDRTHRIGQTKNIFAYRMICKDTIEDKIMQLQERKRLLAKELIADDATFVKALSREDVEYLFS